MNARKQNLTQSELTFVYDVWSSTADTILFAGDSTYLELSELANGKYTHLLLERIDKKEAGTFGGLFPIEIGQHKDHFAICLQYKIPTNLKEAVTERIKETSLFIQSNYLSINTDDEELSKILLKENFDGLWLKADKNSPTFEFFSASDLRARYQKAPGSLNRILNTFGKFGTSPALHDLDRLSDELICPIKCNVL